MKDDSKKVAVTPIKENLTVVSSFQLLFQHRKTWFSFYSPNVFILQVQTKTEVKFLKQSNIKICAHKPRTEKRSFSSELCCFILECFSNCLFHLMCLAIDVSTYLFQPKKHVSTTAVTAVVLAWICVVSTWSCSCFSTFGQLKNEIVDQFYFTN